MASQFEEVVVNADSLDVQNFSKNSAEHFLDRTPRCDKQHVQLALGAFRPRKRQAIHFALWRQRQLLQEVILGGRHVFRQLLFQKRAQPAGSRRSFFGSNYVSHQMCIAVLISVCGKDRLTHAFMLAKRSFDFSQFYAEATHFHLLV